MKVSRAKTKCFRWVFRFFGNLFENLYLMAWKFLRIQKNEGFPPKTFHFWSGYFYLMSTNHNPEFGVRAQIKNLCEPSGAVWSTPPPYLVEFTPYVLQYRYEGDLLDSNGGQTRGAVLSFMEEYGIQKKTLDFVLKISVFGARSHRLWGHSMVMNCARPRNSAFFSDTIIWRSPEQKRNTKSFFGFHILPWMTELRRGFDLRLGLGSPLHSYTATHKEWTLPNGGGG